MIPLKLRYNDVVDYDARLYDDGSFTLVLEVEVPKVLWEILAKRKTGRKPPNEVDADPTALTLADPERIRPVVDKIADDISGRIGRYVHLVPTEITGVKIKKSGSRYVGRLVVVGGWTER